jgi:hypothetical protein
VSLGIQERAVHRDIIVSNKIVNFVTVRNLREVGRGSREGVIIFLTLERYQTEILGDLNPGFFLLACYLLSPQAELVFSFLY